MDHEKDFPEPGNILVVEGEITADGYLTREIDFAKDYIVSQSDGYCPDFMHKIKVLNGEIYLAHKDKNEIGSIKMLSHFFNVQAVQAKFMANIYKSRKLREKTKQSESSEASSPSSRPTDDSASNYILEMTIVEIVTIIQEIFQNNNLNMHINLDLLTNTVNLSIPSGVEIFILHHLIWDFIGFPSDGMEKMTEKKNGDVFTVSERALCRGFSNNDTETKVYVGSKIIPNRKLKESNVLKRELMAYSGVNTHVLGFSVFVRFIDDFNAYLLKEESFHLQKDLIADELSNILTRFANASPAFFSTKETKIKVLNKKGILYVVPDENYVSTKRVISFSFSRNVNEMLHLSDNFNDNHFFLIDKNEKLNNLSLDLDLKSYFPLHVFLDNELFIEQTATTYGTASAFKNMLGFFIAENKFIPAQKDFIIPSTLFNTIVFRVGNKNKDLKIPHRMYARFMLQTFTINPPNVKSSSRSNSVTQ